MTISDCSAALSASCAIRLASPSASAISTRRCVPLVRGGLRRTNGMTIASAVTASSDRCLGPSRAGSSDRCLAPIRAGSSDRGLGPIRALAADRRHLSARRVQLSLRFRVQLSVRFGVQLSVHFNSTRPLNARSGAAIRAGKRRQPEECNREQHNRPGAIGSAAPAARPLRLVRIASGCLLCRRRSTGWRVDTGRRAVRVRSSSTR